METNVDSATFAYSSCESTEKTTPLSFKQLSLKTTDLPQRQGSARLHLQREILSQWRWSYYSWKKVEPFIV